MQPSLHDGTTVSFSPTCLRSAICPYTLLAAEERSAPFPERRQSNPSRLVVEHSVPTLLTGTRIRGQASAHGPRVIRRTRGSSASTRLQETTSSLATTLVTSLVRSYKEKKLHHAEIGAARLQGWQTLL
jgi:hypothetical protein